MTAASTLKLITMLQECAVWGALFIVVYFVTKAMGMKKSIPKETKRRLAEFKKYNSVFLSKISEENRKKEFVRWAKKLKKMQKSVYKVFAVYTYEHPTAIECIPPMDSLSKMSDICQKISACISKNQFAKVLTYLKELTPLIEIADKQLDRVISFEEAEKILQA